MPVPADLPHLIAYVLLPVFACVVIATLLLAHAIGNPSRPSASATEDEAEARRSCRYCRRGTSVLIEHTVRYEGPEVVQTQCFACARCGLPHWVVTRTPHEWRAVR
jgi:hypothetical protein